MLYDEGKRLLGSGFKAVLPADYAMHGLKDPHTYVVLNTDDHKHEGVHWVGLMRNSTNITYFYDSFNRPFQSLSKHWREKPWIQVHNSVVDQSTNSDICGQLVLAAMVEFDKYGPNALRVI